MASRFQPRIHFGRSLAAALSLGIASLAFAQQPTWAELRKQSSALYMKRDLDGAIALERQAITLAEKSSAKDPRIATGLIAVANLLALQGKHKDAIPMYEQGIARQTAAGPEDWKLKGPLRSLARAYQAVGRGADADRTNKRADRIPS